MINDLQGYHKGIIMRLDNPRCFLTREGDNLSNWFNLVQLVGVVDLSMGSLLGNLDVLLLGPVQGFRMPTDYSVNVLHKW